MALKSVFNLSILLFLLFASRARGDNVKADVADAIKGLNKRTRFARGLQDQCVDVYEDLEKRARQAGNDFLHNHVANWHHVQNQVAFELLARRFTRSLVRSLVRPHRSLVRFRSCGQGFFC